MAQPDHIGIDTSFSLPSQALHAAKNDGSQWAYSISQMVVVIILDGFAAYGGPMMARGLIAGAPIGLQFKIVTDYLVIATIALTALTAHDRFSHPFLAAPKLVRAACIAHGLIVGQAILGGDASFIGGRFVLTSLACSIMLLMASRLFVSVLPFAPSTPRRVAVIGGAALGAQRLAALRDGLSEPLMMDIGHLADATQRAIEAQIHTHGIEEIILVHDPHAGQAGRDHIAGLLAALADQPVRVRLAIDLAADIPALTISKAATLRLVTLLDQPFSRGALIYKRLLDITLALPLLLLAAPLMGLVALAVRRTGPALFRQTRIGVNGKGFTVLKFRTMQVSEAGQPGEVVQAVRGDKRVTALGAFLRRASIDELPQLINVLRGEMSLVGPRPHAPGTLAGGRSFESLLDLYAVRHRVKPGLTGLAQVRGLRGETDGAENLTLRVASDLEYIETWSPWLDWIILFRTVALVAGGRNAY
ncbi:MAG: hypothetical protein B7Z78_00065 [Rhodospirillales bacterium 20-60-12]|nr:MAG: hypothetical protein B7Z78_00065 [Rhodospirillales bacterium 20-60-12]HQT68170.1 exopolysaccharide biosynthesis polyprenyl glycosylphosphotransferase [Acetobacteraceae bacterium]